MPKLAMTTAACLMAVTAYVALAAQPQPPRQPQAGAQPAAGQRPAPARSTDARKADPRAANRPASDAHDHGHDEAPKVAVSVLMPTKGNEVHGTLVLTQQDNHVAVVGKVTGLTPGRHGFHIHEFGDLRAADGISAGGHYNPDGSKHGGPHDKNRHAGDLGNISADANGEAIVNVRADGLKLHFVIGRSLVVHAGPDDLESQPAGDSGPRVAVGVIGITAVEKLEDPKAKTN